MTLSRRSILQATAGAPALALLVPASTAADTAAGAVDFAGAGLYLYPAWGEPRPYLVIAAGPGQTSLEFRDPATARLLWTQSLSLTGGFAGRLGGY